MTASGSQPTPGRGWWAHEGEYGGAVSRLRPARADLRTHLLPGVPGGPADMDAALALADDLVADGTGVAVTTPRAGAAALDPLEIADRVVALRAAVARAGIPLDVRAGAEVALDAVWSMPAAWLRRAACGPEHRPWLLLAPCAADPPAELVAAVADVLARGLGAAIAAPAPATGAAAVLPSAALRAAAARGAAVLLPVACVLGAHRATVCALVGELVAAGLPTAVVSAAGAAGAPSLAACRHRLAQSHGTTAADELVDRAPRSLLLRGRTAAVAWAA